MPTEILMPALSPTMTEGNLAAWLKSEGDPVSPGEVIAEIETDKATMEIEAVDEGVLGKIVVAAGSQGVKVNEVIAWLLEEGEDTSAISLDEAPAQRKIEVKTEPAPEPAKLGLPRKATPDKGLRVFASPLAKRIAKDRGLDLGSINGTGPRGRIVKRDVERAQPQAPQTQTAAAATSLPPLAPATGAPVEPHREIPLDQMRKVIAQRLSLSKQSVPHFYLALDCELDTLLALRTQLNAREAADYKLSVNDFVIKASAVATRAKPEVNAIFGGDRLYMLDNIDIAVAVAIDGGLITPIIRQADRKSLVAISNEMKELAGRAKAGRLAPQEFQGGGFSISNLGMYGIKDFQAVINPPQAAILAVGAGERRAVVKDGQLAIATIMSVNLSVDHRVVDGALAAEWLNAFKVAIEDPLGLLAVNEHDFDLAVIGGGPGGYVAAIRASQLGMKTLLVEREHLGGICLNWGCIPTKALLRSAEIFEHLNHAKSFGLRAENVGFDLAAVVERSRRVAKQLSGGVAHLLKKNKVEVMMGEARLGKGAVVVGNQSFKSGHTVIATGARARTPPGLRPDGERIWTYKEAMVPKTLPRRLLVIGSGAIGIEFASFFRALGSEVTVVELADRILPVEDAEISALAAKQFVKRGVELVTGASVEKIDTMPDKLIAQIKGRSPLEIDAAILAVGIIGNIENLGLEQAGVKIDRGHIVTDEFCRTAANGIYAIGDVTGPPWLAHKASHEGVLCVEKIAGVEGVHPLDKSKIPGCTYCQPQIASVGLTEEAAKKLDRPLRIGRFPFIGNGKAIALGEPEGLIKTVFDEQTGELLGAHMIGAEVTELIQGYAIARQLEATEADLIHTVFPHPTLSEMMHESVLDAYGRAIHF